MALGSPNRRDVVFTQRSGDNLNYEQIHASGSNLIFYTDSDGRMTAAKTSSFFNITFVSASWASQSLSSSYSQTASFALNAGSSGGTSLTTGSTYPITASWALFAISASYTQTSSLTLLTQSNVAISSSWASQSLVSISSSWASSSLSSSLAQTASFLTTGTYQITSSWALSASNAARAVTASYVTGSEVYVDKLSTPHVRFGHKRVNLVTGSYTDGLTLSLNDNESVYVKTTIHGTTWPGQGPVGYVSEYILQKEDSVNGGIQPGVILREDNNNRSGSSIISQIVDPGIASGQANVIIQYALSASSNFPSALIVYEVRGNVNQIS